MWNLRFRVRIFGELCNEESCCWWRHISMGIPKNCGSTHTHKIISSTEAIIDLLLLKTFAAINNMHSTKASIYIIISVCNTNALSLHIELAQRCSMKIQVFLFFFLSLLSALVFSYQRRPWQPRRQSPPPSSRYPHQPQCA